MSLNPNVSGAADADGHLRLRVLVIDEELPFPLNAGKRIRSWNLLSRLSQRHDISWICFGPVSPAALEAARKARIDVHVIGEAPGKVGIGLYLALLRNCFSRNPYSVDKHYSSAFQAEIFRQLAGSRFDLLHCEWSPYAKYLEQAGSVPTVVSAHNVEAQIWKRRSEHSSGALARWYFGWQADKMQRFERTALRRATRTIAVSELDRQQFITEGVERVEVVDNGVDIEMFHPAPQSQAASSNLLFLASLDWFPNQDALQYFLSEILPLIHQQSPQARLRVVGRRLPGNIAAEVRQVHGVDLIGEVEDVRLEYPQASVVVVPLRIGGGSRLKILEGMAAGKAVVSTSIGAEGLAIRDGENIILADTPAQFAAATVRLLNDANERERLGTNARALAEQKYSWESLARKQERIWLDAAGTAR